MLTHLKLPALISTLLLLGSCASTPPDLDQDGLADLVDNCPAKTNEKQLDIDGDGLGDACDDDIDGDGYSNEQESIAQTDLNDPSSNPSLYEDDDKDGVINKDDRCLNTAKGKRVDKFGCKKKLKKKKPPENFSNEIKLNPAYTEPMLPKWALGYMQSGWGDEAEGYSSQEKLIEHAKALRGKKSSYGRHKHPADVLVLDMYWNGKDWQWPGNMTWDKVNYPDPKAMFDQLHKQHFKVMMNYHEKGFGKTWLKQLKRDLDYGVDIVWLDFWKKGSAYEKQVWKALKEHHGNDKRIVFMARHYARPNTNNQEAILGGDKMRKPDEHNIEKTMPMHWTGDVLGTWAGFAETIDGIVYSEDGAMGGWSYLHSDTPGHTDGTDPELATRWMQFSDFSSLTRNHGVTGRNVWSWGKEVEQHSYASRMLRYRLLPYIYTYTREIWDKALPLTRPMKLAYPGQKDKLRYQYLFGDEFLVAPVYKSADSFTDGKMDVYLPKGEQWVDYWNKGIYDGGQTIKHDVATELGEIPLFVKRGAIIPMGPKKFWIDPKRHANPITLDVYPKQKGLSSFTLYDDDGESLAYQRGEFSKTTFTVDAQDGQLSIKLGEVTGDYKGKPKSQNYILKINLLGQTYNKLSLNNKKLQRKAEHRALLYNSQAINAWAIDADNNILYIKLSDAGKQTHELIIN